MSHTKKDQQAKHAKFRALERYGLDLTKDDIDKISRQIKAGQCEYIEKQSNRVKVVKIEWKGSQYYVVYDRLREQLVTFLPKEYTPPNV